MNPSAATGPAAAGPGTLHDPDVRGFASDNASGVHPSVLAAIVAANGGHVGPYGADPYTEALQQRVQEVFGPTAQIYPVFNGTGANVVALDMISQRWEAVVCTRGAHINVDECGAPERVAGAKLVPVDTPDGKLTPELVDTVAWGYGDLHHAQPNVLSITQSTETGAVYSVAELRRLVEHAHAKSMTVHVDGARLFNAAAALGVSLGEMTTAVGVDVLSLGATKNGALAAEAVVVLDPDRVRMPQFVRKLDAQLASKMRFFSAQVLALLTDELWRRNALHANAMAAALADAVRGLDGVRLSREPEVNAVFAVLDPQVTARLQQQFGFYVWDEATGEVRWMCSFDTTEDDVAAFAAALRAELDAR